MHSRVMAPLLAELMAGLRVLRDRDHVAISDHQIRERAAHLATAILGNYEVRPLLSDIPDKCPAVPAATPAMM
jgi:hypothetical protein